MSKNRALAVGFLYDDSLDRNDGVSQVVRRLGGWLSGEGHRVSYLVGETKMTSWHGGHIYSLSRNISVSFNGNKLSIPAYSSRAQIKRVLAENKFDVIHVQLPYSPLMAARVLKRLPASTAVVGTFHILPTGPLARFGSRALALVLRRSFKRFDVITSTSQPTAEFARTYYGLNTQVLPNMVDVKSFQVAPKADNTKQKTIVFLGRLVERKGCRQLIEAFALLTPAHDDVRLIIGGSGPQLAKLQAQAEHLGLSGKVSFAGYIDEEEKAKFLAQADIACFPSTGGESFGIVLIEAMAAGAGVVLGGNNPGYASVLVQQPKLLIDPHDTKAFAARLVELLSDQGLRSKLHAWQDETIKRYDTAVVGKQTVHIYRQAVAKRTSGAA